MKIFNIEMKYLWRSAGAICITVDCLVMWLGLVYHSGLMLIIGTGFLFLHVRDWRDNLRGEREAKELDEKIERQIKGLLNNDETQKT